MKHNGIIAIVFIVGCATGSVAAQLVVPPVRAGTSPTRFEYHCGDAEVDAVTRTLNQLGAQGWELVSVAPRNQGGGWNMQTYKLCAKRALP